MTKWVTKKLGEVCTIHGRIGFRGYTTDDLVEKGYGAITFSPSDIIDFKLNYEDCDYISWAKYEESPEIKIYNGDILFCKTASIGKCAIVDGLKEKATINPQFVVLKNITCDPTYLYYKLISYDFQTQVQGITGGSTIKTMSQEKLGLEPIVFPALPDGTPDLAEQRRIAGILSSADGAIAASEALIEKYRNIKRGLLTTLLQPKEGWKKVKLGEVGHISMCKRIFSFETTTEGDIPFYKIGTFGKVADAYITKEKYEEYKTKFSFPKKGDILLSASGTIGRTVIYDGGPAYFQDSNIIWLAHDETIVLNDFLYYLYKITSWNLEGSTIARLYNDNFNKIEISVPYKNGQPDLAEQRRIAEILSSVDAKIAAEQKVVEKYKDVKKGLMERLMKSEK